jgi:hypothetical protein
LCSLPLSQNAKSHNQYATSITHSSRDAAFLDFDGRYVFFQGNYVLKCKTATCVESKDATDAASASTVLAGYPRPISEAFVGLPAAFYTGVDAACGLPDGELYLFKGTDVVLYLFGEGPATGYPRSLLDDDGDFRPSAMDKDAAAFTYPFPEGIDAAIAYVEKEIADLTKCRLVYRDQFVDWAPAGRHLVPVECDNGVDCGGSKWIGAINKGENPLFKQPDVNGGERISAALNDKAFTTLFSKDMEILYKADSGDTPSTETRTPITDFAATVDRRACNVVDCAVCSDDDGGDAKVGSITHVAAGNHCITCLCYQTLRILTRFIPFLCYQTLRILTRFIPFFLPCLCYQTLRSLTRFIPFFLFFLSYLTPPHVTLPDGRTPLSNVRRVHYLSLLPNTTLFIPFLNLPFLPFPFLPFPSFPFPSLLDGRTSVCHV